MTRQELLEQTLAKITKRLQTNETAVIKNDGIYVEGCKTTQRDIFIDLCNLYHKKNVGFVAVDNGFQFSFRKKGVE
jgi:hypothetical protein